MTPRSDRPRLLVYTRTTAYRHESIPAAVDAVRDLASDDGFEVVATEDPTTFEDAIDGCAVVMFLSTSGDVLTPLGRARLAAHLEQGGGFMGVHSAACTEYGWPYYGEMLGARFDGHPEFQPGRVVVEDSSHPAVRSLPAVWELSDEWYDFDAVPPGARILARADESSYRGGGMGSDHPLVWCRHQGRGRVFYTALGHADEAYGDPLFRAHLLGGIRWATGCMPD